MTSISNAAARRANTRPVLPSPTRPTVSPCRLPTGDGVIGSHLPPLMSRSSTRSLRLQASMSAKAWLATSLIHRSGRLITAIPISVAASTSTTSTPMPVLSITLQRSSASITRRGMGDSRLITPSAWRAASSTSSGSSVYGATT